jgi:hypothetical protein
LTFYQTLFPNWQVRAEGEEDGWRWIHFGDRAFYLALNQPADPSQVTQSTGHLDHIGFAIEDSEAIKALLDDRGIKYYTYLNRHRRSRFASLVYRLSLKQDTGSLLVKALPSLEFSPKE